MRFVSCANRLTLEAKFKEWTDNCCEWDVDTGLRTWEVEAIGERKSTLSCDCTRLWILKLWMCWSRSWLIVIGGDDKAVIFVFSGGLELWDWDKLGEFGGAVGIGLSEVVADCFSGGAPI